MLMCTIMIETLLISDSCMKFCWFINYAKLTVTLHPTLKLIRYPSNEGEVRSLHWILCVDCECHAIAHFRGMARPADLLVPRGTVLIDLPVTIENPQTMNYAVSSAAFYFKSISASACWVNETASRQGKVSESALPCMTDKVPIK